MRNMTALACAAALVCGCGGGGDGGSPTGPVATTVALTSSSPDAMASAGDTRTITAVVKDAGGTVITSPSMTWTTSAAAVATVAGTGGTGTVTAVGDGTATITGTSGTATNTINVTVQRKLATLVVTSASASLLPGGTAQLTPAARDARGNAIPGVTGFTYTSSDITKTIVSPTGLVTAISPGASTISAALTRDGVTANGTTPVAVDFGTSAPATAAVTATAASSFTPAAVTIAPGGTVNWTFQAVDHNVTFGAGAGVPANIPTSVNTAVSRVFATAGNFTYQCTLHAGMTGSVLVQPSTLPNFATTLNGANERPLPVVTNGAGSATFYRDGNTVTYTVVWAGLTGPATMAHIHGPGTVGQAVGVLVDFAPANQTVNNGVLTGTFTATNIRPQNGQPAISLDSLVKLMGNGNAYVNVHTAVNAPGEIRGQLIVP